MCAVYTYLLHTAALVAALTTILLFLRPEPLSAFEWGQFYDNKNLTKNNKKTKNRIIFLSMSCLVLKMPSPLKKKIGFTQPQKKKLIN